MHRTSPRRVNWYGHFNQGAVAKRARIGALHETALQENEWRDRTDAIATAVTQSMGRQGSAVLTLSGELLSADHAEREIDRELLQRRVRVEGT